MNIAKQDAEFMRAARNVAENSIDRSTKTGCVIVDDDGAVLASGYNRFPQGVHWSETRFERPEKYHWTEHAERNAIYDAARRGIRLFGSTAYVNWYPCIDCARGLSASGVVRVVCVAVNMDHPKYAEDFKRAERLFLETGVVVSHFTEGEAG